MDAKVSPYYHAVAPACGPQIHLKTPALPTLIHTTLTLRIFHHLAHAISLTSSRSLHHTHFHPSFSFPQHTDTSLLHQPSSSQVAVLMTSQLTLPYQPQRPSHRVLRVNDENMVPAATGPIGKTLHSRTKSTSALAAKTVLNKKVLGDANANLKVAHKDDSEIGKTSPGKLRMPQDPPVTVATFNRPAVRPLANKNGSSQDMHVPVKTQVLPIIDAQSKKTVVPKKSKVLRDVLPIVQAVADTKDAAPAVLPASTDSVPQQPALATYPSTNNFAVQHQEVHKIESVPLRDEPAPRPVTQPVNANTSQQPVLQTIVTVPTRHYGSVVQPSIDAPMLLNMPTLNGQPIPAIMSPAEQDEADDDYEDDDQDYVTAQSFDFHGDATETTIVNPQHTKKHQAELAEAKAWVESNRSNDDVEDELWDASMVAEYGDEIFEYMRKLEARLSPNPYYMESQQEIQWSMRAVLMDWVVQVHQRFNLLPETLFLTVNYIDRFLTAKIVSLGKLQLVGATAIFLAAKYEEVNCPTIPEIIYMVDNGYTADELLKAERFMLSMLQFELGWPGPMSFLRRISKADDYDLETRTLAKYFLEVTIMDERFVGCKPSFLAAGAHCMARLMLQKGEWSKAHVYYSNYTYRQLHRLLGAIFECCTEAQKHHAAVFEKYADKRYKRASTFVSGELLHGFRLPFQYRGSSFGPQPTLGW